MFPGCQVNANTKPPLGLFPTQTTQNFHRGKKNPPANDHTIKHYRTQRKHSTINKSKQTQNVGGLAISKFALIKQSKKDYKINTFKIVEETKMKIEIIRKYQETMKIGQIDLKSYLKIMLKDVLQEKGS